MSLFDKVFKRSLNEGQSNMSAFINALTNLTQKDIEALQYISQGNTEELRKAREAGEPNSFLDLLTSVYSKTFEYGDYNSYTRKQLYEIYDEMDDTVSYISAALDIVSDDATQADSDGSIIKVYSNSEKVQSLTQDLIDDFSIEDRLSKWARAVAKYGDYFLRLSYEKGKGITKIDDTIYPAYVERRDFDGELVAFNENDNTLNNDLKAPWDYVHFRHNGELTNSKNGINSLTNDNTGEHNLSSSYGQSNLKPSIKVYAQLRFTENMILLSRLTNSIRRNIFMINVGDQAPDKSFETIQMYANLLKKNISLDLEQGIYNSQKKTVSYDEDIFIPVSDPKNDVRIEQVGGDTDIGEQYDLEYLLNKLFSSLKIPKAYLNYEQDLNARATLVQLDIRYARSVGKLQQTLRGGLIRLAKINLAFNGIDPDTVDLDIQLTPVSTISAEAQREELTGKIEVADKLWRFLLSINDKLSGGDGAVAGITSMFGGNHENDDKEENDKQSLNMEYAAEMILSDYVGLSREDIAALLNKEDSQEVDSDSKTLGKSVKLRVKSSDPDIDALYPTDEGITEYTRLRESFSKLNITENSEVNESNK